MSFAGRLGNSRLRSAESGRIATLGLMSIPLQRCFRLAEGVSRLRDLEVRRLSTRPFFLRLVAPAEEKWAGFYGMALVDDERESPPGERVASETIPVTK
jgi:hypothetical protein